MGRLGFADMAVATMVVLIGLTYYIGVFLVSLTPSQRIRNVGKDMLEDAGTSIALLVFIGGIFVITDSIFRLVYGMGSDGAYDLTLNWVNNELTLVLEAMLRVEMIPILLRSFEATGYGFGVFGILANFVEKQMAPWNVLFETYGATLSSIRAWVIFMRNGWVVLLLTGALLYTFPASIGRMAGSWIMSIAISFYALLPMMGVFVEIMSTVTLSQIYQTFQMSAEDVYTHILANKMIENPENIIGYVISGLTSGIGDFGTIVLLRFTFIGLFFAIISGVTSTLSRALGATGRRMRLPGLP